MKLYHEFTHYIPPHVTLNDDGTIPQASWSDVYEFKEADRFLLSFTGLGMPPIDYIDQQGPDQHGQTLLGYRLQPRIIQLVHRRHASCATGREGYWTARHDILNHLRPNRQNAQSFDLGRLRMRLPGNIIRDIDVLLQQGPAFATRDTDEWDEWAFTETLRFIAPDPTFYDPALQETTFTVGSGATFEIYDDLIFYEAGTYPDHLIFPFAFASTLIDGEATLEYSGTSGQNQPTWHSYPTIEITGPLLNPIITNETTGETIELDYSVDGGEVVTITLQYGNKTVTNAAGTNLIGTVTPESNLATFHLAVAPEAPLGVNTISVTGSGALDGTTQVKLSWHWRYIGI
jgi:hypothetical protein